MNLSSPFFSIRKEGSIQIWREVWWGLRGGWDDDLKESGQARREVALSRSILDVNTKADASLPDTERWSLDMHLFLGDSKTHKSLY